MSSQIAAPPQKGRGIHRATPVSVREVNRSIVLGLIRLHQPVSRADLSRRTGIFRGNVSIIVDDLVKEGIVTERPGSLQGRGRSPVLLSLNESSRMVLGICVRKLTTSLGLAGISGRIHQSWTFPTPPDPKMLVNRIADALRGLKQMPQELGIAVPGLVNSETRRISWIPALPNYSEFSLAEELELRTGLGVVLDNDCNLGALSEMWLNDAQEKADLIFLNIGGVGVGGGVVLGGQIYRGHDSNFAGEFGHMIVDASGSQCSCGRSGCWELYVSNHATWHRYRPRTAFESARFGELIQAAQAGDVRALNAVRETAHWLAVGVSNIAYALNPATIVVAGEITSLWKLIEDEVSSMLSRNRFGVRIRPARLRAEQSLVHGAACLALSNLFNMPLLGIER